MVVQMTTVGRGRAWISPASGALRRPGDSPSAAAGPGEMSALAPLSPTTAVPDQEALAAAVAAVQAVPVGLAAGAGAAPEPALARALAVLQSCTTVDALKCVVDGLHARSLEDRAFGQKFAAVCGVAHNTEVEGVKLRSMLLSAIQRDYTEHSGVQAVSPGRFLNAVSFLSHVYSSVRISGQPVLVLSEPLLQYVQQLLAGEEQGLELVTHTLALNGRFLQQLQPNSLQEALQHVRTVLMSRNLSGQGRSWLLLALDLASAGFGPLSPSLQAFYQVHLGSVAMAQLQQPPPDEPVATAPSPAPASPPLPVDATADKPSPPRRTSAGSAGSGRTPGSGRLAGRPWTGAGSSGSNAGGGQNWREGGAGGGGGGGRSRGWDHDDRCDRDEGFYARSEPRQPREHGGGKGKGGGGGSWRAAGAEDGPKERRKPLQQQQQQQEPALARSPEVPPLPLAALETEENWD